MCSCVLLYVLQDVGMEYTGTRYQTTLSNGYYQLTGNTGTFVSNRLSDQGTGTAFYSNAGEFAFMKGAELCGCST